MSNEIVYTYDKYECNYKNKIDTNGFNSNVRSIKGAIINKLQIRNTDSMWFFYDEHTTTEEVKYGRIVFFFITADNKFYHTEVLLDDTYETILGAKTYVSKSVKNIPLIFRNSSGNGRYGLAGKIGDDYEMLYGGKSFQEQERIKRSVTIPPNSMFVEGMHTDFIPPGIYEAE